MPLLFHGASFGHIHIPFQESRLSEANITHKDSCMGFPPDCVRLFHQARRPVPADETESQ